MGTLVLVEEATEDFQVKNWMLEESGGVMGEEGEVKGERGGWETITTTTKGGGEGGGERGGGGESTSRSGEESQRSPMPQRQVDYSVYHNNSPPLQSYSTQV